MNKRTNNLRAEAFSDQVRTAIREGDEIPEGPICAAAARTIKASAIKDERFRVACEALLAAWAEEYGVDRPDEAAGRNRQ